MSSSFSHSGTSIDRKSLKRPDEFFMALKRFFDGMSRHAQGTLLVLGALLAVGALFALITTRRDSKAEAGRNALYLAQKSLETALKGIAAESVPAVAEPVKAETGKKDATKDAKTAKAPEPRAEAVLYKKFDVDARLGAAVTQLKAVTEQFSDTRPGFEAALALGNLYFNHGQAAQAQTWFEKALVRAKGPFEKSITGLALGHAFEEQGKSRDAIQAFESALGAGHAPLKGELLLSVARNYELLKDLPKARSTYDQIISQIPGTESSRAAEAAKALLD